MLKDRSQVSIGKAEGIWSCIDVQQFQCPMLQQLSKAADETRRMTWNFFKFKNKACLYSITGKSSFRRHATAWNQAGIAAERRLCKPGQENRAGGMAWSVCSDGRTGGTGRSLNKWQTYQDLRKESKRISMW